MSWYGRLLGYFGLQRKSASTLDLFEEIFGTRLSKSGEAVSWKTALQVSTVLACARVIAEGISQVPLRLYRESPDGKSRLPATDHQLYRVLHRRPNPWQTSFEYRETIALHLVLCGRHYSFINRSGKRILELMPFEPQCVETVVAPDGTLSYKVTLNGVIQKFPAESIWHVKGPSWTGYEGMEAVQLAREAIGLALATESQHAKLHANGVSTTGIYSVDGTLNEAQYKQLRDFIIKNHSGENRGTPLILDRNAKWLSQALSGVDAEHLDTRRFQVEEICRALRVMPIMVGHADKTATYASAEQMFLAHVVHTLSPWYERIEQSIDVNLLTASDAEEGIYAKFVEEGLLRGAMVDTADYLVKLATNGILTRNECRARLDENPLDGLDEPLTPANMAVGAKPEPALAGAIGRSE